jgi:hypothetical protein
MANPAIEQFTKTDDDSKGIKSNTPTTATHSSTINDANGNGKPRERVDDDIKRSGSTVADGDNNLASPHSSPLHIRTTSITTTPPTPIPVHVPVSSSSSINTMRSSSSTNNNNDNNVSVRDGYEAQLNLQLSSPWSSTEPHRVRGHPFGFVLLRDRNMLVSSLRPLITEQFSDQSTNTTRVGTICIPSPIIVVIICHC